VAKIDNITDATAKKAAARFLSKAYSGEMSDKEEAEFYQWLAQSEANQQEYKAMLAIWSSVDQLRDEPDMVAEIIHKTSSRPWRSVQSKLKLWQGVVTLAVVILTVVLLSALPGSVTWAPNEKNIYETSVGEISTVALEDGSEVTLNTDSRLIVNFKQGERRVILQQGEAYFTITKNKERPFFVEVGDQEIKVIGTKFNVLKSLDLLTVSVTEGLVSVTTKETLENKVAKAANSLEENRKERKTHYLSGGSVGEYSKYAEFSTAQEGDAVEHRHSWRQRKLKFDNQSLKEVVLQLNRYRTKKVIITSAQLENLKISGVFHLKNGDAILSNITAVLPVTLAYDDNKVLIIPQN
jgi:transmembrane sensor